MKKFCALLAVVALVAFAAPAFAANPFMDVPMNHWAYDAVGQLAARGIVSGYPDGTYKGNQPITRYEMASVVARGLAVIDMEKASKQDVEMLKRLVVEFKDELDALGVKVDKIDSRLAVLEENIGGWKIWGEFRFDAKFGSESGTPGTGAFPVDLPSLYGQGTEGQKAAWSQSRYRIFLSKNIDEKVKFTARMTGEDINFTRYWLDVALPWEVDMKVGLWDFDWEDEDGLYTDSDAMFTDRAVEGFQFGKNFGMGNFGMYIARSRGGDEGFVDLFNDAYDVNNTGYEYGVRAKFNFNETFWMSLNGMFWKSDQEYVVAGQNYDSMRTYWGAFGVNFNPNIAFKAAYYDQDIDFADGSLWKAIIDVKQDALKFTSLWLEYGSVDDNFVSLLSPFDNYGSVTTPTATVNPNTGTMSGATVWSVYDNYYFLKLEQKWNDKWTTFQRYFNGSARFAGFDDTKNYSFGVKYYYTPALSFELVYDKIENSTTVPGLDDSLVRLRTHVKF